MYYQTQIYKPVTFLKITNTNFFFLHLLHVYNAMPSIVPGMEKVLGTVCWMYLNEGSTD